MPRNIHDPGKDLPPVGMELGRPPGKPEFDPLAGREEIATGREHGDEPETMISTLVLMGVDRGGDFEDCIQQVVAAAESLGLHYVTASIASFDLNEHSDKMTAIWASIWPDGDEEPLPHVDARSVDHDDNNED